MGTLKKEGMSACKLIWVLKDIDVFTIPQF